MKDNLIDEKHIEARIRELGLEYLVAKKITAEFVMEQPDYKDPLRGWPLLPHLVPKEKFLKISDGPKRSVKELADQGDRDLRGKIDRLLVKLDARVGNAEILDEDDDGYGYLDD